MLSRRRLLLGVGGLAALGAAGVGVEYDVLPGRPQAYRLLGQNGEPGEVPDVEPGRTIHSVLTWHGGWVPYTVTYPPGTQPGDPLPLVLALHGRGGNAETGLTPEFALDRFLTAHSGAPFALATVSAGNSYYHRRPKGDDSGAMIIEGLLPKLIASGLGGDGKLALLGWSMGGYGALRLAGVLGSRSVAAVAALSTALWLDPDDASRSGFSSPEEYSAYSILSHQDQLEGIPIYLACGRGDPFYRANLEYADRLRGLDLEATIKFPDGGHDPGYWRREFPVALDFIAENF